MSTDFYWFLRFNSLRLFELSVSLKHGGLCSVQWCRCTSCKRLRTTYLTDTQRCAVRWRWRRAELDAITVVEPRLTTITLPRWHRTATPRSCRLCCCHWLMLHLSSQLPTAPTSTRSQTLNKTRRTRILLCTYTRLPGYDKNHVWSQLSVRPNLILM